jgi:hypothetical protein
LERVRKFTTKVHFIRNHVNTYSHILLIPNKNKFWKTLVTSPQTGKFYHLFVSLSHGVYLLEFSDTQTKASPFHEVHYTTMTRTDYAVIERRKDLRDWIIRNKENWVVWIVGDIVNTLPKQTTAIPTQIFLLNKFPIEGSAKERNGS